MPVNNETINKNLYDVLKSRGYDPVPLDSKGDPTDEIENSDVFRFTYKDIDRRKKGQAWATVEGNELVLYIDDSFTKNPEFEGFTQFMKRWSQKRLLGFKITNKDHLIGDMKKRTVMKKKDGLNEGYYPLTKKSSYSDSIPQVKMIIQHTRQLEEGEQRYRNIAKIFVENANGERFLVPTNRPGLARVYARHIAEGGTPYDDKAKHITTLIEEYSKMAGFVRATRNGQFNESALKLVNEGLLHYNNLRMTLQGMTSHRGYNKYFESYTPMLNEESDSDTTINELFVQEKLDPRIESVLPILTRLNKNITEMSEVKELEEWATNVTEGEERPYVCVHAKKGTHECKATSSYAAAQKAAQHWGLKSTAGINAHLADIEHKPVDEMFHGGFGGQSKFTKVKKPKVSAPKKNDEVKKELARLKNLLLSGDESEKEYARDEIARLKDEQLEEGLGKALLTGAALIAALWGINKFDAETVYKHSKQLQQLEQFHTQAVQAGDMKKAKELEQRIINHKTRLELGYGDVKGPTGEPRDVVYEGTMAHGIFSNDPKVAAASLEKLKQIKSLQAKDAGDVLRDILFDDELWDIIDEYNEKRPDADLMKEVPFLRRLKYLVGWAKEDMQNVNEAPGAETLAHNQDTAEKNLKAFDLAEDSEEDVEEGLNPAQKRVGQLGPTEKAKKISPVLGKEPKQHPFKGKLVGASESVELNAIKKLSGL